MNDSIIMSKRMKRAYSVYNCDDYYSIVDAIELLKKYKSEAGVKFNESVDLSVRLGVDTNKSDQIVKGFVELPNGNGKKSKILVFANDDNIDLALKLGATYAGGDELIEKVANGEISDFDKCVATKNMMPKLVKIARLLGTKGLMPNVKLGTVVDDSVENVVKSLLKGRSNLKTEKDGSIKLSIGKIDFDNDKLAENFKEVILAIKQLRPASVKSNYFVGVVISTTMGVGVKVKMSDIYSL